MSIIRHRLPAVLSDIDGVLYRGGRVIAGSSQATQRLIKPFVMQPSNSKVSLPFSLITNGGGDTEKARTDLVNKRMFGRMVPEGPDDALLSVS